jgi:hypothetical protein
VVMVVVLWKKHVMFNGISGWKSQIITPSCRVISIGYGVMLIAHG